MYKLFFNLLVTCAFAVLPVASEAAPQLQPSQPPGSGAYDIQRLQVASADGTNIGVNAYLPRVGDFPGPRPALVLINSWTLNQYEYEAQARLFASEGYIVISYGTRGFWPSTAYVEVGGPEDLQDASAVLDWLEALPNCDANRIGIGGLSYGAGLSLLVAAHDARIKSVIAMSGWGDLQDALFGGSTVHLVWTNILLYSAKLTGQIGPDVAEQINNLIAHKDIGQVQAWAAGRSPVTYVAALNSRQVPVFLANSFEDDLFPPGQMLSFYEALTGPKMFYLDHGIHLSSAAQGLLGLPDQVWQQAHRWLRQWLGGIDTGILAEGPVNISGPRGREVYADFPAKTPANLKSVRLTPLNALVAGHGAHASANTITLQGGVDSGATTGLPVLSQVASGIFSLLPQVRLSTIDLKYAAVYSGPKLSHAWHLRGAPKVTVPLGPYRSSLQLVAYLYDVNALGKGSLVSYGVISHDQGNPLPSQDSITLKMTSYDFGAGHSAALAIDTVDPLYQAVTSTDPLAIEHADRQIELILPLVNPL